MREPRWTWQSATGTGRTTVQCFRMPKNQPPMPDDPAPPTGEIVLYQTEDGRTRVECRFVDETLWLSQALIAELFQKDVRTVNEHLQNIYQEGEIEEQATIRKFRIVRREGPREVERDIDLGAAMWEALRWRGKRNRTRITTVDAAVRPGHHARSDAMPLSVPPTALARFSTAKTAALSIESALPTAPPNPVRIQRRLRFRFTRRAGRG